MNASADAPLAPLERLAARVRARGIETGSRRTRFRGRPISRSGRLGEALAGFSGPVLLDGFAGR